MAAISKEPINKSFIDVICNFSNKNSLAVRDSQQPLLRYKGKLLSSLSKPNHLDNDRQTFLNQYKSADVQPCGCFFLYPLKITHEGV